MGVVGGTVVGAEDKVDVDTQAGGGARAGEFIVGLTDVIIAVGCG